MELHALALQSETGPTKKKIQKCKVRKGGKDIHILEKSPCLPQDFPVNEAHYIYRQNQHCSEMVLDPPWYIYCTWKLLHPFITTQWKEHWARSPETKARALNLHTEQVTGFVIGQDISTHSSSYCYEPNDKLTSCFSFLLCKMGTILPTLLGCQWHYISTSLQSVWIFPPTL